MPESKSTTRKIVLAHDKDTKNKTRFSYNPEEGGASVTGSLYVETAQFGGTVPENITVEVNW